MDRRMLAQIVLFVFYLQCVGVQTVVGNDQTPGMRTPEVWMAVLPADVLVQQDAQWDFVKKNVDGVKLWTQQIDQEAKDWPFQGKVDAPRALEKIILVLNRHKIPMIIEKGCFPAAKGDPLRDRFCGESGPFDETYSLRAAKSEIERLRRVEALGGTVKFFDVDGPIRHMLRPSSGEGFPTIEKCAEAFVQYMLHVQKAYPNVEFFALTNFPNWGYRGEISYWGNEGWGDYFTALEAIVRLSKQADAPLRGFTVDNPYDYAVGEVQNPEFPYDPKSIDWIARILDVEQYVRKHELEFNLIFNSQRGGNTSAELFCKETVEFIDLYQRRGGRPDRYIIQSWYTHPTRDQIVPESDPNTFTGLVKQVITRVKGVKQQEQEEESLQ